MYYDSTASEPVLICIKHGMLGRQLTLVPAADAVVSHDYLREPFTAEQINQSQSGSGEDELSGEQLAAIGVLFKIDLSLTGPIYSSNLIERRRAEAQKAHQREQELELEAQRRAQEVEKARQELVDARTRASAAAEEAHSAERAREKADAATIDAPPQ